MSAKRGLFGIALLICAMAQADTLVLRSGKTLQGTVVGSTALNVDFLTPEGKLEHIPVTDIDRITYSSPQVAAAPAGGKASLSIPAKTALWVRTIDPIDVDVAKAGTRFRGKLEDSIQIGGSIAVPKGTDVILVASKIEGSNLIELKLESLMINGSRVPVVTSFQSVAGGSKESGATKRIMGGVGLGAILVGSTGGGSGATTGSAAGAGSGAAISASGQQHLKVPAETRLEFRLEAEVKI